MRLNAWWADRAEERFWMEITDREVLGEDLHTPQFKDNGDEYWSYALVAETQPGDVVLHWHDSWAGEPALVGWSEVVGPLAQGQITWQARGTSGRARSAATTGPSWIMPCSSFQELSTPVTRSWLSARDERIMSLRDELKSDVGTPYFPFILYRAGEIRAIQGYLAKFPAALVRAIPQLATIFTEASPSVQHTGGRAAQRLQAARRQQDSKLRVAIERRAIEVTKEYYRKLGASEIIELGKPYDLLVRGLGHERHVEVKGSAGTAASIELTLNEVVHADRFPSTDLVVVDEIAWSRREDGSYDTCDGRVRVWKGWSPDPAALNATRYLYLLPEEELR